MKKLFLIILSLSSFIFSIENTFSQDAGPDQTVCSDATSIFLSSPSAEANGFWTTTSNATISSPSSAFSDVFDLDPGDNVFTWNVPGVGTDEMIITNVVVNPYPGTDQTLCNTSTTTLNADDPSPGTGTWFASPSITFANPTLHNTTVSGLNIGINTLTWSVTTNTNGTFCTGSNSIDIEVINVFDVNISTPSTSPHEVCGDSQFLSRGCTGCSGATQWSVISGTGIFTGSTDSETTVSGLSPGSNIIRLTVTDFSGKCTFTDDVEIISYITESADAGLDQYLCDATSVQLNAVSPTSPSTGYWTTSVNGVSFDNSTSPTAIASNLPAFSSNEFVWNIDMGPCNVANASVFIYNNATPTADAGKDSAFCESTTYLALNPPSYSGGDISEWWSVVSGTAQLTNSLDPFTTVSNLSYGQSVLRWHQNDFGCEGTDDIILHRYETISASAGTSGNICSDTHTMNADNPVAGYGYWTIPVGAGITIDNSLSNTAVVSNIPEGNSLSFFWNIVNGACQTANELVLFRNTLETASAGIDQNFCDNLSTTLTGNAPSFSTGLWSTSGNALIVSPSSSATNINNLDAGINTFTWTLTNGACVSSDDVIVQRDVTITANAGTDNYTCTSEYVLSANTPASGFGEWSTAGGPATFTNITSNVSTVQNLPAGPTTLTWTIYNGTCTSSDDVIITQSDPGIANAGTDISQCDITSINLAADPPSASSTGNWTVFSGTGTFANSSLSTSLVSGLASGPNTYRWTLTNGSCSTFDDVVITNDFLIIANAGLDDETCTSDYNLSANNPIPGYGEWTTTGPATFTNISSNIATVQGLPAGSSTLTWTIYNGTCTSSDDIIITQSDPGIANAGPDVSQCDISSINLAAASPAAGSVGSWTVSSGTGTFANSSSSTTLVSGLAIGSNTYRWTLTNGGCSTFDDVVIINGTTITANAGLDDETCTNDYTLSANSPAPGTGTWSVISGTGTFADISNENTIVSGLQTGANTFRWTINNGGCISSDDVIINQTAAEIANAGIDDIVCDDNTYNLSANAPTDYSGQWSVITGTGTFTDPTLYNTSVTGMFNGINTYRWTLSKGSCITFDEVIIDVATTIPSNAGTDTETCLSDFTLTANDPAPGNGFWTMPGGTATIVEPSNPNTLVTGLEIGQNTFHWTITNGPCSSSSAVIITYTPQEIADAGINANECDISSYMFSANAPVNSNGIWSIIQGGGVFDNISLHNATVTTPLIGENIYRWTLSSPGCSSFDDVIINNGVTIIANAGIDNEICNTEYTLNANAPDPGTGTWSVISGSGIFVDISNEATIVSGLQAGVNTFKWTINNGGCISSDEVTINQTASEIANAGIDDIVCDNTSYNLSANAPSNYNGQWTIVTGSGTFANPTQYNTTVTGMFNGINTYRWTLSKDACSTFDDIVIDVATTITANAGPDDETCSLDYTLAANSPAPGIGTWSILSGGGVFVDISNETTSVTGLQPGVNTFLWTINNGACTSSDEISITQSASEIANAGMDYSDCSITEYTLSGNPPITTTGYWSVVSGTGVFANPSLYNTTVTDLSEGQNIFRWTLIDGICISEDDVIIENTATLFANAGPDISICETEVELYANDPGNGKGEWSVETNSTVTLSDVTSTYLKVSDLVDGDNIFIWTITSGTCFASDEVIVTKKPSPVASVISGKDAVCAKEQGISYHITPQIDLTYSWTVSGGSIVNGQGSSEITVDWGESISDAIIELSEMNPEGCKTISNYPVNVDIANKPNIVRKGEDFIICTDSGLVHYQWYLNGEPLINENKQFYFNEELDGIYNVEIISSNNCYRWSEDLQVITSSLKMYPNPAISSLNLNLNTDKTGNVKIVIDDLNGKIVKQRFSEKQDKFVKLEIPVNDIAPGIYTLKIFINDKIYKSEKIVIQK